MPCLRQNKYKISESLTNPSEIQREVHILAVCRFYFQFWSSMDQKRRGMVDLSCGNLSRTVSYVDVAIAM